MNFMPTKKEVLFFILIAAAIFRIYGLSRGDAVSDEVFMAFRGLGMIDFDVAPQQTTPWEWWDPVIIGGQASALPSYDDCSALCVRGLPWWAKLSMHDHPWGVPVIQNLFMKIFGESNFGFRLPSAFLGIASVYVLYRMGTLLYGAEAGLAAAAIFAVTLNNIYISRLGLQESYVIFAMLSSIYFFIRSLNEPKYLFWVGAIIGIGAEMKYTALILVPMFLSYILLFRRSYFKSKYFWYGMGACLLIFSPSIIYNLELYRATGHFDFQISHILGQNVPEWQAAPGKEIGTLGSRISEFAPRLIKSNSWLFLLAYLTALLAFGVSLHKRAKEILIRHRIIILATIFIILLLLMIGPSYRFLTMLTPFIALAIGNFFAQIKSRFPRQNKVLAVLAAIFIVFEIFYSVNNQIAYYPVGPSPWLSSAVRYENYNWGYNELDKYLTDEFGGRMPAITFDVKYQFLENLREEALLSGKNSALDAYPALIVYAGNFDGGTKLWVLDRLSVYHAWPVLDLGTYFGYLSSQGFDYVERSGFKVVYFIESANWVPDGNLGVLTAGTPVSIRNERGDEAFKIYKTILHE